MNGSVLTWSGLIKSGHSLKMCLAKLWSMYEEDNIGRLRESVVDAEE